MPISCEPITLYGLSVNGSSVSPVWEEEKAAAAAVFAAKEAEKAAAGAID